METKKDLIGSELLKQIIAARVDTLWKMLVLKKENRLPRLEDEGATGEFDNKGALFLPGAFIFEDSDRQSINRLKGPPLSVTDFRNKVRDAMRYDNATLLYPDSVVPAINLNNGFFAEMASYILAAKQAAMVRKPLSRTSPVQQLSSAEITRSYSPTYVNPPYGARTKLSSCIAACLIRPAMYHVLCRSKFGLRDGFDRQFWEAAKDAKRPIFGRDDKVLAGPYVVVCHTTRYKRESLVGTTRILGYGRFGEFAIFTMEEASGDLVNEITGKPELNPQDVFAEYEGAKYVGVLRVYPPTTPGKRLKRTTGYLVSPTRDLDLDMERLTGEAKQRYGVDS